MVNLTEEDLREFMSKDDFDFSTAEGWEEFLAERRLGGSGRDADGFHARDLKNYAVGVATVITRGQSQTARINVRTRGTGLALPPGNLFVYHPDANWNMAVTTFYVGPPGSSIDYPLEVGGPGDGRHEEYWGSLYYIVLKSG